MPRRSGSVRLFTIFGFRVGADLSWFVVLFLVIFALSGRFRQMLHSSDGVAYVTSVISALLLFGSLTVHELGHALVARRRGIEVARIDLFLFGGLTQMSRDTVNPGEDFAVAIAGPLATLGLIVLCLGLDLAIVGSHRLLHAVTLQSDIRITPVLLALSWLFMMNVLLLAFNLVPAFPLDGGRVARALVWRITHDKRRSTHAAARLGQGFALLLGAGGLALLATGDGLSGLWPLALAYLLWRSAGAAVVQSALDDRLEHVRVADIMDTQPVALPADTPVSTALEEYFLRYRDDWFAVTDATGRFVGVVSHAAVQAAVDAGEGWLPVARLLVGETAPVAQIAPDRSVLELLGSDRMRARGAVVAVDADGMLCGVVTAEGLARALRSAVGGIPA
jgi:Zn-dependent protease